MVSPTPVPLATRADKAEEATAWSRHLDQWTPASLNSDVESSNTPLEWNKTYGGTDSDSALSVQQTSDGGYIVAGATKSFGAGGADFWLFKIDGYGNVEWNKTFGGSELDAARDVQQTSDGGYIAVGVTYSFGAGLYGDWLLIKTDAHGDMLWNKTYGGSSWDDAYSVRQTGDGGYIMAGYTASFGAGGTDYWLIKTDPYGDMEWNKTYGGSSGDDAYSVQQTSDGGYIVVGSADSFKTGIFDGEIWLVKTDAYGNVSWSWLSGWPDWDFAYDVQQTEDEGYIIAGTRFSSYDTRYDSWLIKIDVNGTLEWDRVHARPRRNEDVANSVQQTVDGGYIAAGGWGNFWLVKTDPLGNMEWNRSYGGARGENAYCVQQTNDGGYIVAGITESFGFGRSGSTDAWLVRVFPTHDVAVVRVEASKAVVGQGYPLSANVTVENLGFFAESFNVTVYANDTAIGTQTVHGMSSETTTTLVFAWNTTGVDKGNCTLSAYAWPVTNESELSDNLLAGGWVFVTNPGDMDGDRDVDMLDIVVMVNVYDLSKPDPGFDPNCDIDDDGDIDIFDIVFAVAHFGESW